MDKLRSLHMIGLRIILTGSFILAFSIDAYSQTRNYPISPAFRNFTTADGLPSNEVYQVVQDSKNHLWFATDRGVARFNGHRFQTYDIDEGLHGVSVFGFTFDRNDRLWCYNWQCEVYYFDQDTFYRHPVSDTLQKINRKINHIFWQKDTLWVSTDYILLKMEPDKKVTVLPQLGPDTAYISVYQVSDSTYAPALYREMQKFKGLAVKSSDTIKAYTFDKPFFLGKHASLFTASDKKGVGYLSRSKYLMRWDKDSLKIFETREHINHALYPDPKFGLWVGTNKGVYLFDEKRLEPIAVYLPNYDITSIYCDKEGGYWFTSEGQGIFYLPRAELQTLQLEDKHLQNRVRSLDIKGDTLVYNTYSGNAFLANLRNGNVKQIGTDLPRRKIMISSDKGTVKLHFENMIHQINTIRLMVSIQPGGVYTNTREFLSNHAVVGLRKGDSTYFIAYYNQTSDTFNLGINKRNYMVYYISPKYLWLGDIYGLTVFDRETKKKLENTPEKFNIRISGIVGKDSITIISTTGNGVIVCSGKNIINHIDRDDGLADNLCNDIFLSDAGQVWVSTNSGLSMIESIRDPVNYKIHNFSVSDGLPSKQVHDCVVSNGWVAIGTAGGVAYFRENEFLDRPPDFPVYFSEIEINRKPFRQLKANYLSYDQNDLYLAFESVTFRYASEHKFRYRLLGLDSNWRETRDFTVQYNNLPPGEFCFQLQGGTLYNGWSPRISHFSFQILPPFWATWWFILIMIILTITSLLILFRWRINIISRRERIKSRLYFYRQQAIGLQMNPHFFFNSVASIQAHILDNDQKSLLRHLASFAKLIRTIFDVSRKNLVQLTEELSVLKHYLEFEKLRFKEKLQYYLEIDPLIQQEGLMVPPLLIQPIVENAVKHGRDEEGKVTIVVRVKKTATSLIFEIQDSGRGYSETPYPLNKKHSDHISAGLSLVRRRLNLLEEWLGKPTRLEIISPLNRNEGGGTLVIVTVPAVYKNEKNDQSSHR